MKQEEIREIWVGLGLEYKRVGGQVLRVLPLTLDNLFAYAVPEIKRKYGSDVLDILLCDWIHGISQGDITKATEALGQAIFNLLKLIRAEK